MSGRESVAERSYRGLLRLYPAAFRLRFADEMVQLFADEMRDARRPSARSGPVRTWVRTLGDLAVTAVSEHTRKDRTVGHSLTEPPSLASKLLGLVGVLGGLILIVAFVPSIPWSPDFFNLRLVLFNVGAIAIVIGVHRRQADAGRRLALAAAIPAVLANAWYLVMVVRVVALPGEAGRGDYGPWFDVAATAMWLADAWFGIVVLRLGVASRAAGAVLGVGSVLALGGLDRLGLVSGQFAAIVEPLALAGIALNGIAWIALGLELALRRRRIAGVIDTATGHDPSIDSPA